MNMDPKTAARRITFGINEALGMDGDAVTQAKAHTRLAPLTCSAIPVDGIRLEDIRNILEEISVLPDQKLVRVSDEWWVMLEDGKPTISVANSVIEGVPNAEVSQSGEPQRHEGHKE